MSQEVVIQQPQGRAPIVNIGVHFLGRSRPRRRSFRLSSGHEGGVVMIVQALGAQKPEFVSGEDLGRYFEAVEDEAKVPDEGFRDFNGFLESAALAWDRLFSGSTTPVNAKE